MLLYLFLLGCRGPDVHCAQTAFTLDTDLKQASAAWSRTSDIAMTPDRNLARLERPFRRETTTRAFAAFVTEHGTLYTGLPPRDWNPTDKPAELCALLSSRRTPVAGPRSPGDPELTLFIDRRNPADRVVLLFDALERCGIGSVDLAFETAPPQLPDRPVPASFLEFDAQLHDWTLAAPPEERAAAEARLKEAYASCPVAGSPTPYEIRVRPEQHRRNLVEGLRDCGCAVDSDVFYWVFAANLPEPYVTWVAFDLTTPRLDPASDIRWQDVAPSWVP